jgi:DNA-binding IclR family transcriptional regulator
MARQTRNTITTRAGLIKELRRTAARGYATTLGEWREDVIGISSPLSSLGSVVGAIGVSCPLSRTNQKRIETMGKMVRSIAERIASFSEAGKAKPIIREMQS